MFCKKLVLIAATAALALGTISAKEASNVHVRVHSNSKNVCSGPGQSPMSVEGVAGVFCVSGQACVANISNGACPGPQAGLPNGAVCGVVKTGVYGCKPAPPTPAPVTPAASTCNGPNSSPMSVEGVPGVFCVTGQACVANISNGACPGPQTGLPNGASCGVVRTGVYGCKPNAPKHHHKKSHSKNVCSGPGQSPMSVEGVAGVFCVTGQACVANIGTGACPGPQAGLPNGAECGKVKTGVYGCKPKAAGGAAPQTAAPGAPATTAPAAGTAVSKNTTVTSNKTTTITTVTANKTVSLMISLSEDSEDSADAAVVDLTVSADDSDDSTDDAAAISDDSDDSDDSVDADADSEDSVDADADSEDDDSADRRL